MKSIAVAAAVLLSLASAQEDGIYRIDPTSVNETSRGTSSPTTHY